MMNACLHKKGQGQVICGHLLDCIDSSKCSHNKTSRDRHHTWLNKHKISCRCTKFSGRVNRRHCICGHMIRTVQVAWRVFNYPRNSHEVKPKQCINLDQRKCISLVALYVCDWVVLSLWLYTGCAVSGRTEANLGSCLLCFHITMKNVHVDRTAYCILQWKAMKPRK